ncbi:serine hydrolase [Undibacterium sp. TJN19]|uniref:serine hydrolase n=1 Tax=Undibacterium sp. TJN19 TaxID=3413055 RepID=UPI003BF20E84
MYQRKFSSLRKQPARSLWLVFAMAVLLAPAFAHADEIEVDVNRVLKLFDVPGISVAIVQDGKVLVACGFGVRKLGEAAQVDSQTLFEIAANSKAFTAVTLAMLVDEGKLAWDDPVIKHLPDFQMYDPYVTREMTVRDLLSNRSGLGEAVGDLMWWPSSTFSTDEIVHNLRFLAPATSFRSVYTYEYLPYIVAGKLIAVKTGKPWGAAVRERIFTPLDMKRTTASLTETASMANLSSPHAKTDGKLSVIKSMPMENAAGAMGINTSAEDIAKWMMLLLDGGKLGTADMNGKERRLYSAAQSREMWTPQIPIRVSEPKPQLAATRSNFAASGLGFELRDYHGLMLVTHRGWQFGFYSVVAMVPSAKLGIAIMTNAESGPALNALKYQLLDRYLDMPKKTDWIATYNELTAKAQAEEVQEKKDEKSTVKSSPSLALTAYDGEYRDPWYGSATIKMAGTRHVLSFARTPGLTGELKHFQNDTFIVR